MARSTRGTGAGPRSDSAPRRTPSGPDSRTTRSRGWVATIVGSAVIGGLGACAAEPSAEPVGPQTVAAIQTGVEDFLDAADPYGQVRAVLVYRDGEPVLESYRGGADEDDYWDTRSVTKSVMSALIGIAIEDGSITGVDATLGELLPSYSDVMTPQVAAITLEQVLTHTAGFAGGPGEGDFAFWLEPDQTRGILQRRAQDEPVDGDFVYTDAGAFLLSAVLSEATGRSVLDYAREKLFDPIGIDTRPAWEGTPASFTGEIPDAEYLQAYYASSFAWPTDPQGHHWGDCCLRLRPQELAHLGELYLNGGAWVGEQVVPADWVEQSTSGHVDDAVPGFSYGYLWWVTEADGSPAYAAWGRGGQLIEVVPNLDLVVVVATEIDYRDPLRLAKELDRATLAAMVSFAIAPHLS